MEKAKVRVPVKIGRKSKFKNLLDESVEKSEILGLCLKTGTLGLNSVF